MDLEKRLFYTEALFFLEAQIKGVYLVLLDKQ